MFGIRKYTTSDLVEDIKRGGINEQKAITHLIRENEGKILSFVSSRNGSTADGEDIFQEGLTALILNIRDGKFKGDSSINTYLFAICKGIWYKKFRKVVRDREYQSSLTVVEEDYETPEYNMMDTEQKDLILELFGHLKTKCKETLYMWGSSFSMTEIADQLGFSSSQVAMNKKNKCLKELRNLMESNTQVQQLVTELS